MSKSKRAAPATPLGTIEWAGIDVQRVAYEADATIFAQGDPSDSVMYVARGVVRLSVLSHAGKEAVIAVLGDGHFFGEGCLVGQAIRMATASAMTRCTIVTVGKPEMVRQLHEQPAFADRFLTHMLTRNIRIEEDLIDQIFNSSEKRLARNAGRDDWDDTLARELLHEQISKARVHRVRRRLEGQQLSPRCRAARLTRGGALVQARVDVSERRDASGAEGRR